MQPLPAKRKNIESRRMCIENDNDQDAARREVNHLTEKLPKRQLQRVQEESAAFQSMADKLASLPDDLRILCFSCSPLFIL